MHTATIQVFFQSLVRQEKLVSVMPSVSLTPTPARFLHLPGALHVGEQDVFYPPSWSD